MRLAIAVACLAASLMLAGHVHAEGRTVATLEQATLGTAKTLAGFTKTEEWQEAFNRRFAAAE